MTNPVPQTLPLDALSSVLAGEFSFERPLSIGAKWLYCGLAHFGYVGDEAHELVAYATRGEVLSPSIAYDGHAHFLVNWFAFDRLRAGLDGWKARLGEPGAGARCMDSHTDSRG